MQELQAYSKKVRAALSPDLARVFSKLKTAEKIQDYLDSLPINFDMSGDLLSSKRILETGKAQCIEGAMFAAASLSYHGEKPLLMDFQTAAYDEDHVVALFRRDGCWGAISKTNHAILRWRDPVYKTLRELAMSFFHEYYMHDGRKTLKAYSVAFDMRRYEPSYWIMSGDSLDQIAEDLDLSRHFPTVVSPKMRKLRKASAIEIKLLDTVEWKRPKNSS